MYTKFTREEGLKLISFLERDDGVLWTFMVHNWPDKEFFNY